MSRGPCTFRHRDVLRAIKATTAAGLHVLAVKIDPQTGTIEIVTGDSLEQNSAPLDQWMAKHARQAEGH
jgi:hypothetical protein